MVVKDKRERKGEEKRKEKRTEVNFIPPGMPKEKKNLIPPFCTLLQVPQLNLAAYSLRTGYLRGYLLAASENEFFVL